ncbi:IS701 family transposase [Endozoicomonas montiporae CL-33]|nr:IS701 family transposase [Endozoicomonas montiporae CL-33]
MGIVVTKTINWAAFERRSLGRFKATRLCWMFYQAEIAWQSLLQASVRNILLRYGIQSGTLAIDDTGKKRTKRTSKIDGAHKIKDKSTGGYFNGQELVFMVLVTEVATFPVGFRFYIPDPELSAWRKKDKALRKQGIQKKERPNRPEPDHVRYPTMQSLTLVMLQEFVDSFPNITIKAILADALYGTGDFMDKAAEITGGAQVVSQLRSNQKVSNRNHSEATLKAYFSRQKGAETQLIIRGGKEEQVTMLAARLYVKAHGKRRFVIALKYEGEEDYRYLVASDMSWRHTDIARIYTLRWLVEVFIQDWKAHCGWNRLSKQQGADGSQRGVILSLLCEHMLLLHPEQFVLLKNKQAGMPAGCLIERLNAEALLATVKSVVESEDPDTELKALALALEHTLPKRESSRHMAGRDLGEQKATDSLKAHARKFKLLDAA